MNQQERVTFLCALQGSSGVLVWIRVQPWHGLFRPTPRARVLKRIVPGGSHGEWDQVLWIRREDRAGWDRAG